MGAAIDEFTASLGAGSTAEIKRMYVDPSVRGRGIGRALVEALEREARRVGVTTIVLETIAEHEPMVG